MTEKALIVVAGVIGLGAIAYFYEQWNKKSKKKYVDFIKKIKSIKHVHNSKGGLNHQAISAIVIAANEEGTKELNRSEEALIKARRKYLAEGDYDEYIRASKECMEAEKEIEEDFISKGLNKLGIEREEFEEESMRMSPEFVMAQKMQKQTEDVAIPKSLTPAKTKEIFLALANLHEKYGVVMQKLEEMAKNEDKMMANALMGSIMQYLSEDVLMVEYRVTEEQYTSALKKYKTMEDPEIVRLRQSQEAMAKLMGMMGQQG